MRGMLALVVAALVLGAATPAMALGTKFGVRAAYGLGFPDPDKGVDSASAFQAGLAAQLDLAILAIEVDALWARQTTTFDLMGSSVDATADRVAFPVLVRGGFPLIPAFLSLDFGGGLEPRFAIGASVDGKDKGPTGKEYADSMKSMTLYLPIFIGATLDLKLITANLDIRYERQLTASSEDDDDARFHELLFMAGVLF